MKVRLFEEEEDIIVSYSFEDEILTMKYKTAFGYIVGGIERVWNQIPEAITSRIYDDEININIITQDTTLTKDDISGWIPINGGEIKYIQEI